MNRNYRRGYKREIKAKKILLERGYYVIRSAGSKGLIDLIAISNREILLIQIKSGKAKMDKKEKLDFVKMLVPLCGVRKEIWYFSFKKKEPVIEVI